MQEVQLRCKWGHMERSASDSTWVWRNRSCPADPRETSASVIIYLQSCHKLSGCSQMKPVNPKTHERLYVIVAVLNY